MSWLVVPTIPIKPYTYRINYSAYCCHCRAKKLVPSNFFFQDRISPPSEGAKAALNIWCHKCNMSSHPTPRSVSCPCRKFVLIVVLFCWLGKKCYSLGCWNHVLCHGIPHRLRFTGRHRRRSLWGWGGGGRVMILPAETTPVRTLQSF